MSFPALSWRVTTCILWVLSGSVIPAQNLSEPKVELKPRGARMALTPSRPKSSLRLDVTLIQVPVIVTDALDRPIGDLPPDHFRVFEDGVEQRIASVVREEGPVSVGFIFDSSSSMKGRMEKSIAAVRSFLETMTPGDEFFLMRFADAPHVLTSFTPNPEDILSALAGVQPEGWTALNDAICLGMQRMKSAKNARRALFVLTDGGDNNSRYSEQEVRSLAREANVRVYSVGLMTRPRFLEKIAEDTGGRAHTAARIDDLPKVVEKLSVEFRNTYMVGYSSKNDQHDGKYRRVRVEILDTLSRISLHAFWKLGYYAPRE